ncbi:MAG: DNA repair protein RecN [Aquabacterium sp.]
MLHRLTLRDFVLVRELALDLHAGFTVLTGETGAGKSILVDALQLALGARGDAGVLREGAQRAEISAEFDSPPALRGWLDDAGFADDGHLLLRRVIDAQGRSRAWINGSPATIAQLREAGEALVEIHGQHAWQGLTRPEVVRGLVDERAGVDASALAQAWRDLQSAQAGLARAVERGDEQARERERLAWQVGELDKLAPGEGEWAELTAEHTRLAHGQALLDAARTALDAVAEAEPSAQALADQAVDALSQVSGHDARLAPVVEVLQAAVAQLQDAAHSLGAYLGRTELDPQRLAELDQRIAAWHGLARRWRCAPQALPAQLAQWRSELQALEAGAEQARWEQAVQAARSRWTALAAEATRLRQQAAGPLAQAVTQAMQGLGMAGGQFEVAFLPQAQPQAFGAESLEFRVASHPGATPKAVAKVASGGELSRLALAIAVTLRQRGGAATLIFDEIDAGIGGAVADAVGGQMHALGRHVQVLAVTHLAQVASQADHHVMVSKRSADGQTQSEVRPVAGEPRVAEIARMLGGAREPGTSLAHAQALLRNGEAAARG